MHARITMRRTATMIVMATALLAAACGSDDADTSSSTTTPATTAVPPPSAEVSYNFDAPVSDDEAEGAARTMATRVESSGYPGSTAVVNDDGTGLEITVVGVDTAAEATEVVDPLTVTAAMFFRPVLAVYGPAPDEEASPLTDQVDDVVAPDEQPAPDDTTAPTSTTTTLPGADVATTDPAADDPDGTSVLPQVDLDGAVIQRFEVGPQQLAGTAVKSATSVASAGGWAVKLVMNEGQDGIDGFNDAAAQCKPPTDVCPLGRLGIVVDSIVLTAPGIRTDEDSFTPYSASGIYISAEWFTEEQTTVLAAILTAGALPVGLTAA